MACANAVCWSIITPPFQVPDEPEHVAYVKQIAELGRLPTVEGNFSFEEATALSDVFLQLVAEEPEYQTISTRAQQKTLEHALPRHALPPEVGNEYAGVAASQPPLYYALQSLPYTLGRGATLLDRIALMRLLSCLFGGLTALFAFMFVRETLPRIPWAWTVGGLGVALVPLLGFMSGSVNPDSMLYAVTAMVFYVLARSFRRGLTRGWAIALGALTAIGFATKLNFVGLAPGVLLGLTLLSVRAYRVLGRAAYVTLAVALAVALSPVMLYVAAHVLSGEAAFGIVSSAITHRHGDITRQLSYIWQFYMPRLPGMRNDFAGVFTTRQLWFDGYVGQYGWLDTPFPAWVTNLALLPAAAIGGLCLRTVLANARVVRGRGLEIVVYGAMAVGLMVLIAADSYASFPRVSAEYAQVRYLLPLIPLLGVILALAARGAGRRWGTVVGVAILTLFLAHDMFSQLQLVARFYG